MKTTSNIVGRGLVAAVLGSVMIALPAAAFSDTDQMGPAAPQHQAFQQRKQEMIEKRLDGMADRLQITASQQDAWNRYTATVKSIAERRGHRPPRDADAAALLRFKADRMAQISRRMDKIAGATADLERVLTPEQKQVLREMVMRGHRNFRHRREAWR